MFLGSKSLGTDGVRSQNRRLPGLDEDEKLLNLFPVATRKDWETTLRWWTLADLRIYSVFILGCVASDKPWAMTSVSSGVPYRLFCRRTY